MNLTKFKTVDQAFKTTVIVASSCCLIMGIAFTLLFVKQDRCGLYEGFST